MSLRTLDLPLLLNTSDQDLFRDFFVPALTHAFRYNRGVGYFASGWLRLAAQGMVRDYQRPGCEAIKIPTDNLWKKSTYRPSSTAISSTYDGRRLVPCDRSWKRLAAFGQMAGEYRKCIGCALGIPDSERGWRRPCQRRLLWLGIEGIPVDVLPCVYMLLPAWRLKNDKSAALFSSE